MLPFFDSKAQELVSVLKDRIAANPNGLTECRCMTQCPESPADIPPSDFIVLERNSRHHHAGLLGTADEQHDRPIAFCPGLRDRFHKYALVGHHACPELLCSNPQIDPRQSEPGLPQRKSDCEEPPETTDSQKTRRPCREGQDIDHRSRFVGSHDQGEGRGRRGMDRRRDAWSCKLCEIALRYLANTQAAP